MVLFKVFHPLKIYQHKHFTNQHLLDQVLHPPQKFDVGHF